MPGSPDRPLAPDQPESKDTPQQLRMALSRPDAQLNGPETARVVDRPSDPDRPVAWSRADLEHRLERLPPGHPSAAPDSAPDKPERSYWSEVPRFLRAWADHLRRWPDNQQATTVDRSRDPEGSWRGDGNQFLDPDQHAQAKDMIAGLQQAEKSLTKDMQTAARENPCGGWLDGLEHRLKGEDRLKEKIAELSDNSAPDASIGELAREIPDAIRYTFCFEPDRYADGYLDLTRRLEASEYRMIYSKNHWRSDPEYKGINTRWITPEGQRFEIQFHTVESFHAKQEVTHRSYERSRNPLVERGQRREIEAFHRDVCSYIAAPADVDSIPDYLYEGS